MKNQTVILYLFSLFMLTGCSLQKSSQAKIKTFPTKSFVQVVKILHVKECKSKKGCAPSKHISTGSGSVVDYHNGGNIILTAGHVCNTTLSPGFESKVKDHKVDIFIVTFSNEHFKAEVINHTYKKDSKQDLCLLHAKGERLPAIRLARSGPTIGEETYSMAAPAGIFHPPTVPLLSGIYSGPMPDKTNVMYTIPAVGGSSGAPIMNSKMELVGMIHAAVRQFHHVTVSISYIDLRKYLKKHITEFKKKK